MVEPITVPGMFQTGDHASRPAAGDMGKGSLYSCTTHSLVYQTDGSSWTTWATLGSSSLAASAVTITDSAGRYVGTDVEAALAEVGMVRISDSTLGGTAASFDLTSIPGGFKHLKLELNLRSDRAGNNGDSTVVRFNNDSGSNYDYARTQHDISQFFYSGAAGATGLQVFESTAATATAGAAGAGVIEIPDYAGTTFHKTVTSKGFTPLGTGTGDLRNWSTGGRWRSTSAITRITIFPLNGSNWIAGSRCTLYGLA